MTIRTYLVAILTVAAVTAVASAVAAEGGLKKYVNLILSVVVMLTLLAPLGEVLAEALTWETPPVVDTDPSDSSSEALLTVTAETLRAHLCEELELPSAEVQVHIDGQVTAEGDVTLHEVAVILSGESRGARERVWVYLNARVSCSVRVAIRDTDTAIYNKEVETHV